MERAGQESGLVGLGKEVEFHLRHSGRKWKGCKQRVTHWILFLKDWSGFCVKNRWGGNKNRN